MKRIGLTQRVEIYCHGKEHRDCLDQAWGILLSQIGFLPIPLMNSIDHPQEYLRSLDLDGFILTGGNDLPETQNQGGIKIAPDRDKFEKEVLQFASQEKTPLLGVCRGLQKLVEFYGGHLTKIENHVGKPHWVEVKVSKLFLKSKRIEVNSFHNFGFQEENVPKELEILGRASDGSVESLRHHCLPQYGIMWHPERDPKNNNLIKNFFN